MSAPVRVSSVDVQRARLLVRLGEALKKPTPTYVRQIAAAKPAGLNGQADSEG